MKKITEHIIKVQFLFFVDQQTEYYFGSLAAIFNKFTEEQIGCSLNTLYRSNIEVGQPKSTRNCIISKHILLRKSK